MEDEKVTLLFIITILSLADKKVESQFGIINSENYDFGI